MHFPISTFQGGRHRSKTGKSQGKNKYKPGVGRAKQTKSAQAQMAQARRRQK